MKIDNSNFTKKCYNRLKVHSEKNRFEVSKR